MISRKLCWAFCRQSVCVLKQEAEHIAEVWRHKGHSWVTHHSVVAKLQYAWFLEIYLPSCCTNRSLSQAGTCSLSLLLVSLIQISLLNLPASLFIVFLSWINLACLFFKENAVYYKLWILFQICLQSLQTVIVAFSKLFQAQGNMTQHSLGLITVLLKYWCISDPSIGILITYPSQRYWVHI